MNNALSIAGIFSLALLGCVGFAVSEYDARYGIPQPREVFTADAGSVTYHSRIRPLLESRCVVCHGCYDAPCQLKLDAWEGLVRGAHKDKVYDGTRLLGANLTRLFEDASTTSEWRDMGFYPVLNERRQAPAVNLEAGVMARMLALKQEHPLPVSARLPETFDLAIDRTQQCPKIEQFDGFARQFPLWGMPYGLPGLNEQEHSTLMGWLAQGAPAGAAPGIEASLLPEIARLEDFFNGDSLKQQLASRYLYEHLFLAHLHFPESPNTFFRLVRSRTPPGEPIARISTRRPFDDPGVERVYYRLWHDPSSRLAKTLARYHLDSQRRQNWQRWFVEADYTVSQLPGYAPEQAANPFATFVDLPVDSRYRFLLDEAEFTIMNFIKGPVCRGQVALNVIQDHFWVFFVTPEAVIEAHDGRFLAEHSEHLHLPAGAGDTLRPLTRWLQYAEQQKRYLRAKAKHTRATVDQLGPLRLEAIWDGEGTNDNAALTVFRHNDSASVVRGLVGPDPKTAWVINYPLLERIHYLLVAGFDVYGNVSHQLLSRLYMDFLRIEGEMNFVSFLPESAQEAEIRFWYREAESDIDDYLQNYLRQLQLDNAIDYQSEDAKAELFTLLRQRLAETYAHSVQFQGYQWPRQIHEPLALLQQTRGLAASLMPETTLVHIPGEGNFTLLRTSAHTNLSSLFGEDRRRRPEEDSLVVVRGIIGAYPNSFLQVPVEGLPALATAVNQLANEADYRRLKDRFGIRRADPDFWHFSDRIHSEYFQQQPFAAGLLDYNRLENR